MCDIAGVPVVLVVDEASEIRGFINICRHRAHIVVYEPKGPKTSWTSTPRSSGSSRC